MWLVTPVRLGGETRSQVPGRERLQRGSSQDLLAKYFGRGISVSPPQASWAPKLHEGHVLPMLWQLPLSFCTTLARGRLFPLYVVVGQTTSLPIQMWRSRWHRSSGLWQGLGGTDRKRLGLLFLCCCSSEKRREKDLEGKPLCCH